MSVTAVVVAGGRPDGVDTLLPIGGVPMVVRAVRSVIASGLVSHVVVLDAPARRDALARACSGLPVSGYDGFSRLPRSGGVLLLHDAARPLAPSALVVAVVEVVRAGHDGAVPVLALADTVKQVDVDGLVAATPDRSGLRVIQTPQAIRADLLDADLAGDPLTALAHHAAAGGAVHTVPGHPRAFAVRGTWDLELAEWLVARGEP